jgi:hypothetical protein
VQATKLLEGISQLTKRVKSMEDSTAQALGVAVAVGAGAVGGGRVGAGAGAATVGGNKTSAIGASAIGAIGTSSAIGGAKPTDSSTNPSTKFTPEVEYPVRISASSVALAEYAAAEAKCIKQLADRAIQAKNKMTHLMQEAAAYRSLNMMVRLSCK